MSAGALFWFSCGLRDDAGIVADARLHDLRHSHASHAIMNGENLRMAGRLLDERSAATTNRYAHLDDDALKETAERVAEGVLRGATAMQLRVLQRGRGNRTRRLPYFNSVAA